MLRRPRLSPGQPPRHRAGHGGSGFAAGVSRAVRRPAGRRGCGDPGVLRLMSPTTGHAMFVNKPLIADRKIRFAVVGCGRISANHVGALAKHAERAEPVAVCDVDPAALNAAEARTGVKGFRSLTELLAGCDADVVILSTPSGLHAEQAVQAAAAGRHVMTEKPMATTWQDGHRMVDACDRAGVQL